MKREHIVSYNVRRICKIRNVSFQQLADYVAIEPTKLHKTLATNPDYRTMKRISVVLGYPMTELVRSKVNAPLTAIVMSEYGSFYIQDANTLTSAMQDYRKWRKEGKAYKKEEWSWDLRDDETPEDFYKYDTAKQ